MDRAALVLLSALAVAACGSGLVAAPIPPAPPTANADAKGGYIDPRQTPTPRSTPQPYPAETPAPGDAGYATARLEDYQRALVGADWATAYGMLGAAQRSATSLLDFARERAAFMASAAGRFALEPAIHDRQTIEMWTADAVWTRDAELSRAFVFTVDYPAIPADTNANFEVFLVAPDRSAAWRIWPLR